MIKLFTSLLLLAWFSVSELGNAAVHHERHPRLSVNPASAAVILVHGWSCDSTYWSEQLPALRQHFDVITIDLAGRGKTPATRDDFSMASFGRDVAEVANVIANDVRALPGSFETAASVRSAINGILLYDRPDDWVRTLKARTEAQTVDSINAAARAVIRPSAMTRVVVGDLAKIEPGIRALGLGEVQILDLDGGPVR